MKKQSVFYPLVFGIVFFILGIALKEYLLSVTLGIGLIIIFIILCIHDNKEKKLASETEEYRQFSRTTKYMITLENNEKIFRYISVRTSDNQPYEVWCKYTEVGSKKITVHEKTPRKITFDEFIKLVDEKYPGIGIMYEGINENNWESYLDVKQFWNKISEDKKPLTKDYLDSFSNKYVFKSKKYLSLNNSEIDSLVAISEFFFDKGFVFKEAYTGGGVNEISHTGDKAYSAEYTDFEVFRSNFVSDFLKAEETEIRNYEGWVTSLNYGYVVVKLERNELSVQITASGNSYTVIWGETAEDNISMKEETNETMLKILGNNFYLAKYN